MPGEGAAEVDGEGAGMVSGEGAAVVDGEGAGVVPGKGAGVVAVLRQTRMDSTPPRAAKWIFTWSGPLCFVLFSSGFCTSLEILVVILLTDAEYTRQVQKFSLTLEWIKTSFDLETKPLASFTLLGGLSKLPATL